MNGINIPMALLDFVPVVFCGFTAAFLIGGFRKRMTAVQGAFFSAGAIMLVTGGFMKALWKLLFALEICDMTALTEQFFPNQAAAFLFLSVSTIGMLAKNKTLSGSRVYSVAAVPVVASHLPFIIVMTWGLVAWYIGLVISAVKLKRRNAAMLIAIALVVMLTHSALGTKFDSAKGILHWIAESQNVVAQFLLMLGAWIMNKAMKEYDTEK